MPRKLELTFQKGANGRTGRWKKFYRGKTHYLGRGRSKSDLESYQAAVATWRQLRAELDAEDREPTPTQLEYDGAIRDWELALSWAMQHNEHDEAGRARSKLDELRERRNLEKPIPLKHHDKFESRFRTDPVVVDAILKKVAETTQNVSSEDVREAFQSSPGLGQPTDEPITEYFDVDPLKRSEIQWQDRLNQQQKFVEQNRTNSLGFWLKEYLGHRLQRVDAADLSPGRFASTRTSLEHFCRWLGKSALVEQISGQTLTQYHSHQLQLISRNECAAGYGRDRMTAVRSFVRWLWGQDAIESLPKNIDSKQLNISRPMTTPEFLVTDEVQQLLRAAMDRTRLYILLGLNCGMTQKDIADLTQGDVDWDEGVVRRKRSKTQHHDRVPTVTHKLWPETMSLLSRCRSERDLVLLNQNGTALRTESLDAAGKHRKSDNVK